MKIWAQLGSFNLDEKTHARKKSPVLHYSMCFQMNKKTSAVLYQLSEKLPLSQQLYVTSEGAVSHNINNYHQLSIARYQVSLYAHNYLK